MGNCFSDQHTQPQQPNWVPAQPPVHQNYGPLNFVPNPSPQPPQPRMPAGPEGAYQPPAVSPVAAPSPPVNAASSTPVPKQDEIEVAGIARKTGEVLIICYDLGTTASGCAYIHRRDDGQVDFGPENVDQWPGQAAASMGKTPSVLLYDQSGQCQTQWGAECLDPQWSAARLNAQGLQRVEWFKLHVDPSGVPPEHLIEAGRTLPNGVTVWRIYADFLQKLHAAAVTRFRSRRGADLFDRLTEQDRVQYILTVPAAWQKPVIIEQLRVAAIKAGLINADQRDSLDFCAEPEASALECYDSAAHLSLGRDDIFTVIDAGGGTVDFTTYQVLSVTPNLTMKEVDVGSTRCLYSGSTFVDRTFENFLRNKLKTEHPDIYQERHLLRGTKAFVTSTKLQFSNSKRQVTYLELSDNEAEYNQGYLELQWHDIEMCFKPHVDQIVEVAKSQVNTTFGRSKVVFCSGGFGCNEYLRERLAAALPGIEVLQPGDKSLGSRAVSLGGTRYGMFRSVQSRISHAWYGVKAWRNIGFGDRAIPGADQHTKLGKFGKEIMFDTFATVLPMATSVGDGEWKSSSFTMHISDQSEDSCKSHLEIYTCTLDRAPDFVDQPGCNHLCQVDVYVPPNSKGQVTTSSTGVTHRAYSIKVLLSLGRADLKTRVLIDGVEAGGATVTWT